ncbi:MAG: hypothetical protein KDA84_17535 [Planctomycetaceae bacterium]|nr:hypothetical protein [Planctomycetaceae bacterium]
MAFTYRHLSGICGVGNMARTKKKKSGCMGFVGLMFLGVVGMCVLSLVFRSSDDQKNKKDDQQNNKQTVSVVFDVASLSGKTIDEIRESLWPPQDDQVEPTAQQLQIGIDEWTNVFRRKDGQELLITFNPKTRQVVDFFLAGDDKTLLMQKGNLTEGNPNYRIETVKAIANPSKITGIKIVPTEKPKVEFISSEIRPFTNPMGKQFKMVYVKWKNAGKIPVRIVDAHFKFYDRSGRVVQDFDYTIYAVFNDAPGVQPGETYIDPEGEGHVIVDPNVSSVGVGISKVKSEGMSLQ